MRVVEDVIQRDVAAQRVVHGLLRLEGEDLAPSIHAPSPVDRPHTAPVSPDKMKVPCHKIDSLAFARLDLLKIDVEGMEAHVLYGGRETIARCKPVVIAEHIFCSPEVLRANLPDGYILISDGENSICVAQDDPVLGMIKMVPPQEEAA
jgi:hypothetical protein